MGADSESYSHLKVPTINSKKSLELAVRSWNSRPNLFYKKSEKSTDSEKYTVTLHVLCFSVFKARKEGVCVSVDD